MDLNTISISENILKYRITAKLNKKKLATMTGLSANYISMLENRAEGAPSMEALLNIAEALNVTVEQLLFENLKCLQHESDELINQINKELIPLTTADLQYLNNFLMVYCDNQEIKIK